MPDMTGKPTTHPTDETDPSARLTIGSRVVVRYRLADSPTGQATDILGELVARSAEHLVIDAPSGRTKLLRRDVVAAKDVPPKASRPGPAHLRVSTDDLALVTDKGWVATDRAGLGSWVLRSAPGYTGRANSVLPVGDPTLPLDKALDYVENWYAERGQPAMFQVHGEPGFDLASHPVAAALLARGYGMSAGRDDSERVLVMTGPSAGVPPLTTESLPVVADAQLSPEWLMAYGEQRTVVPGITEAVLTGSDGQLFLSIRDEATKRIVATARMAIHPGWAGVFGLWVHPDQRRRGLAQTIMSAIAMVARENNMPAIYLQVGGGNTPAVAFYEGLGFSVHHEYVYLTQPERS